ncbi:MAG: DUF1800 domain-containing protein [Gemmatimonadota bacterium]
MALPVLSWAVLATIASASPQGEPEPVARPTERQADAIPDPPIDTAAAIHLLERATFGVRPADIGEILDRGIEGWLERQLHPERIPDEGLEERLRAFPAATLRASELYEAYPPPAVLRARFGNPDSLSREMRRELRRRIPHRIVAELAGAKLQRAVYSERQLEEVLVDFWFNHFNVFFGKGADRWLVGDFEREAIRRHVLGRFADMLEATASHPAMLFYLDNWRSSLPDSLNPAVRLERAGRRPRSRQRGLNENYARELLELHTLGVDGGYTQADVIEVARAFTGWTIAHPRSRMGRDGMGVEFRFRSEMHDPGDKVVLGRLVRGNRGMEEGREILRRLAEHPSTARHLATKLVERFVADDPPPGLVNEIASVYLTTGGDLREVTRALLTSERFFDPAYRGAKLRSPFELVAAALRITGSEVGPSRDVLDRLRSFGHLPYLSDVPTGYPEASEEWVSSGAMLQRMNFALALSAGELDGVRLGDGYLTPRPRGWSGGEEEREAAVGALLAALLPGRDTERLAAVILDDLEASEAVGRAVARRALGLALGSPDFQRH